VISAAGVRIFAVGRRRHGFARRRLLLASLCLALWGAMVLWASPAGAAPLSDCTTHRGTLVAVDFAHWGGPIVRGCGIGQPTGYALLHAAGFTTGGDAHDGAAFICRIGNSAFHGGTLYPTPSEEPCTATPSTSGYWSYWIAPAGRNRWTYSPLGPMGDVPKPGEVELYMFGSTNVAGTHGSGVPKFPPSSLRPSNPGPPRNTTPSSSSPAPRQARHRAASHAPRAKSTHATTAGRRKQARNRHSRRGGSKPPDEPTTHGQTAVGSVPVVAAKPTDAPTSSGSATPLVLGLCLALVLSAGALWAVRRRRRYE
jgi:hypothetical protein